jgi:tetratricopeptide (TPR) repeat protein
MRKAYVVVVMVVLAALGIRPVSSGAEVGSVGTTLAVEGAGHLDSAEASAQLADVYARAGLVEDAIDEYRRSIELDPTRADRHFRLGLAYQSQRWFDEALAAYREAARLEPESAWARAAMSIVQAKMGQRSAAFQTYRQVKSIDEEVARELLEVLLRYGSFHDA